MLPPDLFEEVGDNWAGHPEKPIALFWDFNEWKRPFVSRYFPDYRTAFLPKNSAWQQVKAVIDRLDPAQTRFVIWGANERQPVVAYAAQRGIGIMRVEDGFIRSSELGGRHTTALSLAIDDQGIYFDARSPSRLETLLSEADFDAIPELIEASRALLKIIRDLNVSKYNLASLQAADNLLGPHVRRRVLVLGQVEADASIRCGMAEGWTDLRLIKLAVEENPYAEILYKPHPDVLNGLRENMHLLEEYTPYCRVLEGDLVLGDLFKHVDHVYTLTSLSGFEALIHGVTVTTIGAPFYSGWGLTDDRTKVDRRARQLTVEKIFCAAYLLYPKYMACLDDPVRGCLATIMRILAERGSATDSLAATSENAVDLFETDFWPAALRPGVEAEASREGEALPPASAIGRLLNAERGYHYQLFVAHLLCGRAREASSYENVLEKLRVDLHPAAYEQVVCGLWEIQPSRHLLRLWASICEQSGDLETAQRAIAYLADGSLSSQASLPRKSAKLANRPDMLELAQFELRNRRHDEALSLFLKLLLAGEVAPEIFEGVAEIARLKGDFSSAAAILRALNCYEPSWRMGRGHLLEAQALALDGRPSDVIAAMASACLVERSNMDTWPSFGDAVPGALPFGDALRLAMTLDDAETPIGRARILACAGRYADAESLLLKYKPSGDEFVDYAIQLSTAYRGQGRLEEARRLMVSLLARHEKAPVYREALHVAHALDRSDWGAELLRASTARGIQVGEQFRLRFGRASQGVLAMQRADITSKTTVQLASAQTEKRWSKMVSFGIACASAAIQFSELLDGAFAL